MDLRVLCICVGGTCTQGVRTAGYNLPREQMKALISLFDRGGKGHISLDDFKFRFKKHIPRGFGMGSEGAKELEQARKTLKLRGAPRSHLSTDERIDLKVRGCTVRFSSDLAPLTVAPSVAWVLWLWL